MSDVALPQPPRQAAWLKARTSTMLHTSASQIEAKRRCKRYWWFDKVRRLKQPQGKPQTFGTVLHAVAERYLLADDLGRDTNGDPVNLYPDDWHVATNRFTGKPDGEINDAEQAQVRKLIEAAIENGVLERRPDRGVEREFSGFMLEHDGVEVTMLGYIDLEHVGEIQDHKTTSNMRYAHSPKSLVKNVQMLIYAKQHLEFLRERGAAMPTEINLRHNVYCKNWTKPEVRKVEARVTVAEIEEAWLTVLDDVREMVELRATVEDGLSEIPDLDMAKDNPCMAYGGCPFRRICSGAETIEKYQRRLDNYAAEGYVDPQAQADRPAMFATPRKDQTMTATSFAAKLAAKRDSKAKGTAVAPPTLSPPKLEPVVDEGTPDSPSPTQRVSESGTPDVSTAGSAPPWAVEACPACKGVGFNTKGSPCRICQHKSSVSATSYELTPSDDGTMVIVSKTDPDDCYVCTLPEVKSTKSTEKDAATEPADPPVEAEDNDSSGGGPDDGASDVPATSVKKKRSRKSKTKIQDDGSFMLCINCGPIRGSDDSVVYLSELLNVLGPIMAVEAKVDSFYDIHAFDRRDALAKNGEAIVETYLQGRLVVAEGIGTGASDVRALLDAIRPHASLVLTPNIV